MLSTPPLNPRAYEIAAWTMTLPVSAAFDLSKKSKNGELPIVIGAASFCRMPGSGERIRFVLD
jgi:hypothetical protein